MIHHVFTQLENIQHPNTTASPFYQDLKNLALAWEEDPKTATPTHLSFQSYEGFSLCAELPTHFNWSEPYETFVRFLIFLSNEAGTQKHFHSPLLSHLKSLYVQSTRQDNTVQIAIEGTKNLIEEEATDFRSAVITLLESHELSNNWITVPEPTAEAPFENSVHNLLWQHLPESLPDPTVLSEVSDLFVPLPHFRPATVTQWIRSIIQHPGKGESWYENACWANILANSSDFDELCLAAAEAIRPQDPSRAFFLLDRLLRLRNYQYQAALETALEIAATPKLCFHPTTLELLLRFHKADTFPILQNSFSTNHQNPAGDLYLNPQFQNLFQLMAENWTTEAQSCLLHLLSHADEVYYSPHALGSDLITDLATTLGKDQHPTIKEGLLSLLPKLEKRDQTDLWQSLAQNFPTLFLPEFQTLLSGPSKPGRELAATTLAQHAPTETLPHALELLTGKKVNQRAGAALFLTALADPAHIPALQDALEKEKSAPVQKLLAAALPGSAGVPAGPGAQAPPTQAPTTPTEAQAFIKKPTGRALSEPWLTLSQLPPLLISGQPLPEEKTLALLTEQSRLKTITPCETLETINPFLLREETTPFALALFDQWLGSDQAAKTKWVLTLVGALGNETAIPRLTDPIQSWADNSRHKMAEYSAQAIALIPGDTALTVLDSLANRYRSKYKNIGKACRSALEEAAKSRNVSLDELADLIVPTLNFNEDLERPLPGTEVITILQPDFKLTFYNPETEKETKSPPSNLPEEAKEDIKSLRKLIRETLKGQTARLEQSLVRQRRWPTARWQELFEVNPFLQTYATNLVWATFDEKENLHQTFRRYPNGLLANAAGELIEFTERDQQISLIHPLLLSEADLTSWQDHCQRMKVKPPFPQLDRPTAVPNPDHGNRRQLDTCDQKRLLSGTFRSRAERRGWERGSVVDAGFISSYLKHFPDAGIDVFLEIEDLYIGQYPEEEIGLGKAMFVKENSVQTGSYTYDEPRNTDDPRVLSLADVPPVIYSETLTDLEAFIA